MEALGQVAQMELLLVVAVDVLHRQVHDGAALLGGALALQRQPVQQGQKLQQAAPGVHLPGVACPLALGQQLVQQGAHLAGIRRAQPVGVAGGRPVEAAGQRLVAAPQPLQAGPGQPEHDALVGPRPRLHRDLMQLQRADQQQVPRLELVDLALDAPLGPAAQKEVDLVEIVVVQPHRLQLPVAVVEHLKVPPAHLLAGVKGLEVRLHGATSFFLSSYRKIYNVSNKLRNSAPGGGMV